MITVSDINVFVNEYSYVPGEGQNTIFYIGEDPWYGWKGKNYIISQLGDNYYLYYVEDNRNLSLSLVDTFPTFDSAKAYAELTYE